MKTILNAAFTMAVAGLSLVSCNYEEEPTPIEPLKVSQEAALVGYDLTTCNLVETFGTGTLPRWVSKVSENRAIMLVTAQKRTNKWLYAKGTAAALLDPLDPNSDLIRTIDARIVGISGLLTVGDASGKAAHQTGGRVIFDFSPVNYVTMKSIVVTDIGKSDKGSKVQLFSKTWQLLDQKPLPETGDKGVGFVTFNNIPGVARMIVTFGDETKKVGSGSVARLQLCIDGEGLDAYCNGKINSVWLQYTGKSFANVTVKSRVKNSSTLIFSRNFMLPGTMFHVANPNGFGEALIVESSRKDKATISMKCNGPTTLKKQYGNFRLIEVRSNSSYPLLLK